MPNPNEDLFALIQSLTPSEKRYFKLFAQRQGDDKQKLYVKIFDIIDAMPTAYDESILKKKLKTPAAVKQLPQLKTYLFDLIMRSMRLYRSDKDVANQVFDLIQDELFFTEKGLTDLRIKAIKKGKELAYAYDLTYLLIALLRRERVYTLKFPDIDPFAHLAELHEEEDWVLGHLNNEVRFGEVFYGLRTLHIKDPTLNEKVPLPGFEESREVVMQTPYDQLKTFLEKFFWLRSHALVHRVNRDFQAAFEKAKMLVDLFTDYPQHRMNVMGNYMDSLGMYLGIAHAVNNYSEYDKMLDMLQAIETNTIKDKLSKDLAWFQYTLLYTLNTDRYQQYPKVIEQFESILEEFGDAVPESYHISQTYNIALLLFINEQWDAAMDWCNRVLEERSETRAEIQHGALLLTLLLHLELGNIMLFESAIRSAMRTMKLQDKYRPFEQLFCSYLKKIMAQPKRERKEVIQKMYDELLSFYRGESGRKSIFIIEALAWCNTQITGTPLAKTIHLDYK